MKLVLLPGLDGTGVLFRPFLKLLPTRIDPIVVSYPTDKALGYDELLPLVRLALPATESFILLGESFGGPLALRIAAEHPANLNGLILAGSFVSCPYRFVPIWTERFVPIFPFRGFPLYAIYMKALARFRTSAASERAALSVEAVTQVDARVFARRVREIIQVDVTRELELCDVPILYLRGARDWIVPSGNLKRIIAINASVQTTVISSSHMILKNQPQTALDAILRFVEQLPKKSANKSEAGANQRRCDCVD